MLEDYGSQIKYAPYIGYGENIKTLQVIESSGSQKICILELTLESRGRVNIGGNHE